MKECIEAPAAAILWIVDNGTVSRAKYQPGEPCDERDRRREQLRRVRDTVERVARPGGLVWVSRWCETNRVTHRAGA